MWSRIVMGQQIILIIFVATVFHDIDHDSDSALTCLSCLLAESSWVMGSIWEKHSDGQVTI